MAVQGWCAHILATSGHVRVRMVVVVRLKQAASAQSATSKPEGCHLHQMRQRQDWHMPLGGLVELSWVPLLVLRTHHAERKEWTRQGRAWSLRP